MKTVYRVSVLLAALLLAANIHAATLAPYQQAALKKILATFPAEQRDMIRPQLESTLAALNPQQVDMMLKNFAEQNTGAAQDVDEKPQAPEKSTVWGKVEADFDRVVPAAQAFMDQVSDQRDAMNAHWDKLESSLQDEWFRARATNDWTEKSGREACERELGKAVPKERRKLASIRDTLEQQDRIKLRQIVQFRARYGSLEQFKRTMKDLADPAMLESVRYTFASPLGEADAKAALAAIDSEMAALIESSSRERHKIEMTAYADQGQAVMSGLRARDVDALRQRTEKAAVAICAKGRETYERALVGFVNPLVPKVKPYER